MPKRSERLKRLQELSKISTDDLTPEVEQAAIEYIEKHWQKAVDAGLENHSAVLYHKEEIEGVFSLWSWLKPSLILAGCAAAIALIWFFVLPKSHIQSPPKIAKPQPPNFQLKAPVLGHPQHTRASLASNKRYRILLSLKVIPNWNPVVVLSLKEKCKMGDGGSCLKLAVGYYKNKKPNYPPSAPLVGVFWINERRC